jgi:hypothetical protein
VSGVAKRTIGPVEPAGNVVARRRLGPADESARAQLTADRPATITGRQRVIAPCWRCGYCYDAADTGRYQLKADGWPVCTDETTCNERAAKADLVLVLGTPEIGGTA